ncbi:MAG: DUF924 domain-containing protein [Alphaproteobacteria bacterium]|nr:DUF924 domain-containing protein [Alphaproteobacteria bacterium]MCB9929675.1 DUF924 domain-containing protein [Alphaproteobacteria bacterium]
MSASRIAEITRFWLGPALESPDAAGGRRDWWYRGGEPVDAEIRTRFGDLVPAACEGGLTEWEASAEGAFALVLLLDQFTRNIYRATPRAYAGDPRAMAVVRAAIDSGRDAELHPVERIWLYHPYHHSERIAEQDQGLTLLQGVLADAAPDWRPYVERSIQGWTRHRNIVARFGRFPHRNRTLGRESTAEELAFLQTDGESFGQGAAAASR